MFELSKSEFIEIAANNFESFGLKMEPVVIHSLANNLYDKASPGDFLRSSSNEVCCKSQVDNIFASSNNEDQFKDQEIIRCCCGLLAQGKADYVHIEDFSSSPTISKHRRL